MNCITPYNAQVSGYAGCRDGSMEKRGSKSVQQQSLSLSRTENVDLAIKTRDGDIVTLKLNSFSELESFSYDSKGKVNSENSEVSSTLSHRSMSLNSGSSFTFSVQGDLSREELDDIEEIVKTIDDIVADMASNNMDEAVETALGMGGYETVSQFTADLRTTSSYRMETSAASTTQYDALPARETQYGVSPARELQHGTVPPVSFFEKEAEKLVERMTKELGLKTHNPKNGKLFPEKAKSAVDQLFNHHLNELGQKGEKHTSMYKTLSHAQKEMQKEIDQMLKQQFRFF